MFGLTQLLIAQNIYYGCDNVLCEGYERHAEPQQFVVACFCSPISNAGAQRKLSCGPLTGLAIYGHKTTALLYEPVHDS